MGDPVGAEGAQRFNPAGHVVERGNGLIHGERSIACAGFLIEHGQFIPHELRIASPAARIGDELLQQLNGLIEPVLLLEAKSQHQAGIDEKPGVLHRGDELFLRFLQQPHVLVGHAQRVLRFRVHLGDGLRSRNGSRRRLDGRGLGNGRRRNWSGWSRWGDLSQHRRHRGRWSGRSSRAVLQSERHVYRRRGDDRSGSRVRLWFRFELNRDRLRCHHHRLCDFRFGGR